MLNIVKTKQKISYPLLDKYKNKELEKDIMNQKSNNIIYYPSSTKEWSNSVYSYNKGYTKELIVNFRLVNNLFKSYFNMFENRIKNVYKRRHASKKRYSANKLYVSRAELKHSNTKLTIILYIYNKQKSIIERNMRKLIKLTIYKKYFSLLEKKMKSVSIYRNRLEYLFNRFIYFKKWKNLLFKKTNNILKNIVLNIKKKYVKSYKMYRYNRFLKRVFKFEKLFTNRVNLIKFNNSKFNNLVIDLKDLGLSSFLEKIFGKKVKIKIVELKSIHLNSDVFSGAVALKLRDRKKKAVRVLRRAVIQMVKIPDLHTLITFYDDLEKINKNNILKVIKQQVVSGVRFEAKGRLTRRLTAMRAIFKYRYTGSLKNVSASYNNIPSTMLRGYAKSNVEYTIINSKTRNGAFGLKGWVSSH
jgi:hypothetical protein